MPVLVLLDSVLPQGWLPAEGGHWSIERLPRPGAKCGDREVPCYDTLDDYFAEEVLDVLMRKKDEYVVFLIEAHARLTSFSRATDYEGIELLKHIRLTRSLTWEEDSDGKPRQLTLGRSHAIIHCWAPLSKVLSTNPGNLILCTQGVTFVPTHHVVNLFKDETNLNTFGREQSDIEDDRFVASVRADYTPPPSDHDTSNWWGVRQLALAAKAIGGAGTDEDVPTAVEEELKKLYHKKAFFLAGTQPLSRGRKEARLHRDELRELRKLFSSKADGPPPPRIVHVDDEMDKGWGNAVHFILTGRPSSTADHPAWFHTTMGLLAQPGNSDEDWRSLANMILEQRPDLILTDLRLLGSLESSSAVRATSGAKLVSFLREQAPAVPILMMTASNKAWTFQEAFRLGVDAYWMKEGIGDHSAPAKSVQNAAEIVRLIRSLLGEDYQLLRRIQDRVDHFKSTWGSHNRPWWEEMRWPDPIPQLDTLEPNRVTQPNNDRTFGLLQNLVHMYREYLRLFTLRYGSSGLTGDRNDEQHETKEEEQERTRRKEETADFWVRSIVVQVGRVIECVHCFDVEPRSYQNGGTIGARRDKQRGLTQRMRKDWFGQGLYDIRNIAAHYNKPSAPPLEHRHVRSLLAALFAWLSTKPKTKDFQGDKWPRAESLFAGSHLDVDLVNEYRKLFGSVDLRLPSDPDHS